MRKTEIYRLSQISEMLCCENRKNRNFKANMSQELCSEIIQIFFVSTRYLKKSACEIYQLSCTIFPFIKFQVLEVFFVFIFRMLNIGHCLSINGGSKCELS